MLGSSLYECEIWHARTNPRAHSFKHRHFMFFIALEELSKLDSLLLLLSTNGRSLYNFNQADYLPDGSGDPLLANRVKTLARNKGVVAPIDKIRLLTNVRISGYVFNPVSFFFCHASDDKIVCCVVEVGNTFGEKKAYVLRPDDDGNFCECQEKSFYVSPFTDLDDIFSFRLKAPGECVDIHIDTLRAGKPVVQSAIAGKRLELSDFNLFKLTFLYPLAPLRVITLIHLHALLLWIKGVPYHKKEENITRQTEVMLPHRSITEECGGGAR